MILLGEKMEKKGEKRTRCKKGMENKAVVEETSIYNNFMRYSL